MVASGEVSVASRQSLGKVSLTGIVGSMTGPKKPTSTLLTPEVTTGSGFAR